MGLSCINTVIVTTLLLDILFYFCIVFSIPHRIPGSSGLSSCLSISAPLLPTHSILSPPSPIRCSPCLLQPSLPPKLVAPRSVWLWPPFFEVNTQGQSSRGPFRPLCPNGPHVGRPVWLNLSRLDHRQGRGTSTLLFASTLLRVFKVGGPYPPPGGWVPRAPGTPGPSWGRQKAGHFAHE